MKVVSCFPPALEQRTNEPEEGEIVDDYELISSDEELCMRQRIRELEEENAEIEQIAVISRSYDIDRAARIPTDVSSISSTEFKTPKKRKRHKNKEHRKKSCHHHHSTNPRHRHHGDDTAHIEKKTSKCRKTRCKRREKLLSKKNNKISHKDIRDNINYYDSSDSIKSISSSPALSDSDYSTRNISGEDVRGDNNYYHSSEIRDTLRLAVARSRKNSTRQSGHNVDLKQRLLRRDLEFTGNQFSNTTNVNNFQEVDEEEDDVVLITEPQNEIQSVSDDSSDSLEEKELRLLALKSAMIKKHMDRKKRNAVDAYSPTDFDSIISTCVLDAEDKLDDLDVVDLDDDDSEMACATASPIASPQIMMLEGQEDSSQMMDCKPVDMDIANSDSDECPPAPHVIEWNSDMASAIPYPPYPPNDFASSYPFGLYLPEFSTAALIPPPPGVDDYDEIKPDLRNINFDVKSHNIEAQDMDVENDEIETIEIDSTTSGNKSADTTAEDNSITQESNVNSETVSLQSKHQMNEENQEEEEEQALRALLLAKLNSPKNHKKTRDSIEKGEKENRVEELTENIEAANKKTVKPTEAILKEAVKRLKVVSMFKEENICDPESIRVQTYANESPTMWLAQQQQEFIDEIPLPPKIHISLNTSQDSFEISKLNTLQCLKRRVNELNNHTDSEIKNFKESISAEFNGFAGNEDCREYVTTSMYYNITETEPTEVEHEILSTKEQEHEKSNFSRSTLIVGNENLINPIASLDDDTKRRLQKLKDEILHATLRKSCEFTAEIKTETAITENQIIKNLDFEKNNYSEFKTHAKEAEILKKQDFITPKSKEDCVVAKEAARQTGSHFRSISKTKKLHSNENKKESFVISVNNSALKENNVNKNNKPAEEVATFKTEIKNAQAPKKLVRTVNKTVESAKNKVIKPIPTNNVIQTSSTTVKTIAKPLPTYSVLRTTKIVKPNKVINTNILDLKRKVVLIKPETSAAPPSKIVKTDAPAEANTSAINSKPPVDNTRLITSMDQVKHMCNVAQLIITVNNSENESSDEEWVDCDSMYKPVYDFNDISSPMSYYLESPCLTPTRSNSPVEEIEIKANPASKPKRSPIIFNKETTAAPKTPIMAKTTASQPVGVTPVAVRHLPTAAQDEYRKLVNRMKLLENQRNKKEFVKTRNEACSINKEANDTTSSTLNMKPTLVKQVLLRNTSNNKTNTTNASAVDKTHVDKTQNSTVAKPQKANVLRTYESLYVKIGAGIVNNLDKSLGLVSEAKKAKINKLKLETRLKKLKAEMELLQSRHKEEEQKISSIYPNICMTNEIITSMKQKRSKVFKAALNLGRTIKGEDYSLNNDLKQTITFKSKKLATEIKMINSLKAEDIDTLLQEEQQSIAKNNKNIEDNATPKLCKNKGEKTQKLSPNVKINGTIEKKNTKILAEIRTNVEDKDDVSSVRPSTDCMNCETFEDHTKDDNRNINPSNSTIGVNTEFQDKETAIKALESHNGANTVMCQQDDEALNKGKEVVADNTKEEQNKDVKETLENDSNGLLSYTSPLEHLRNINGSMDPYGVVCPFDLMGICEDTLCKYVHISRKKDKDL